MSKYRKKPVVVEAVQWFKHGDHENVIPFDVEERAAFIFACKPEDLICEHCNEDLALHGWINTLEGGHKVCPNDWIITGIKSEQYPCKPDIFEQTYDKVNA